MTVSTSRSKRPEESVASIETFMPTRFPTAVCNVFGHAGRKHAWLGPELRCVRGRAYRQTDVREALFEMTGGMGPDACIDCFGMRSHGLGIDNIVDKLKVHIFLGADGPAALRLKPGVATAGPSQRFRPQ